MFKPLQAAVEIWKFRKRMARALRDAAPRAPATAAELDALVALQTAHWQQHPPLVGAAARPVLQALNAQSISVFVVAIQNGRVRLWPKPARVFAGPDAELRRHEQQSFQRRARLYQAFIAQVVRRSGFAPSLELALDVTDIPLDRAELPVFGFQKVQGAHNLLMPDVDFFHSKWYRGEHDALAYADKSISACFVGSSTGAWLDLDRVQRHDAPRLRAAAYFDGHASVVFKIANAVQCLTPEAKACLLRQPYFSAYVGWSAQLRHRFILSIDGNGAACSRLVKGLHSHSVVVKFDSDHGLYYFPAMVAGRDYLAVANEAQVEQVLAQEAAQPGTFAPVSVAGQAFADKYLTIHSVMDYTARLLGAFAALRGR